MKKLLTNAIAFGQDREKSEQILKVDSLRVQLFNRHNSFSGLQPNIKTEFLTQ